MKKVLVYFLLFIFTIQSTKGLWIISSFHINRSYIAYNLCINRFDKIPTCKGQCFLNKQLEKEQKESKSNPITLEKDYVFIAPFIPELTAEKFKNCVSVKCYSVYKATPYSSFLFNFENPPELS